MSPVSAFLSLPSPSLWVVLTLRDVRHSGTPKCLACPVFSLLWGIQGSLMLTVDNYCRKAFLLGGDHFCRALLSISHMRGGFDIRIPLACYRVLRINLLYELGKTTAGDNPYDFAFLFGKSGADQDIPLSLMGRASTCALKMTLGLCFSRSATTARPICSAPHQCPKMSFELTAFSLYSLSLMVSLLPSMPDPSKCLLARAGWQGISGLLSWFNTYVIIRSYLLYSFNEAFSLTIIGKGNSAPPRAANRLFPSSL